MEFIKPTYEIWEQGDGLDNLWKHIAKCTRVCYQSTPKNNGESDEEFVKRVILRDSSTGRQDWDKIHGAMLEHGTIYLYICPDERNKLIFKNKYENNKYSHVNYFIDIMDTIIKDSPLFITTNLRVICENDWFEDLKYVCKQTEHHAKRVTVSFTTNIGVTREFNRHRVDSMAEESTRYCNYTKNKQISTSTNNLGSTTVINDVAPVNGHIRYGLPAWLLNEPDMNFIKEHQYDSVSKWAESILDYDDNDILNTWDDIEIYLCTLTFAQWGYNMLIKKGWKPQQAREVLPLATKSQLIHTAFIDDWKHFFALRADGVSGPPHPNAALVAKPLKEEFIKRGYI